MHQNLREAFEAEMATAKSFYATGNLSACFFHLERAHILGQRFYIPHVISHWWMLKVGWRRADLREIFGQVARIVASAGSLLGWLPAGNTGGANVSPIRPMSIPEDLALLLENEKAPSLLRLFLRLGGLVLVAILGFAIMLLARHYRQVSADGGPDTANALAPLGDIGAVKQIAVTPLVNWKSNDPNLATEAGVSYLVAADDKLILFDLGSNAQDAHPSPLEANMAQMQRTMEEIDMIFLSHGHFDHVGGRKWAEQNSFSTGSVQRPLDETIRIFAPSALEYPGHSVKRLSSPAILDTGIASIGPIGRTLIMGRISEQALAIHVEGHGILLLIGCGHQTLEKIIIRTQSLFTEPIFGIIGDLHYPVPDGRMTFAGLNLQRIFASGSGPLSPLDMADVEKDFALLEALDLQVLAMGSHDTSDTVLDMAAERFGPVFQAVKVGQVIKLPS